jgi:hypothetical protein
VTATRCACGFTELADESLADHLQRVFTPDDARGNDGLIHEEGAPLACRCGLVTTTGEDLDDHFLAVFTPADGIGRDGQRHAAAGTPR